MKHSYSILLVFFILFSGIITAESENVEKHDKALKDSTHEEPPTNEVETTEPKEEQENDEKKEAKPTGPETTTFSSAEIGIQGNWRKKKDWLKQALDKNELIQDVFGIVQNFKKTFYTQSLEISQELGDFYEQAGFDEGEISSLFDELSEEIESAKAKTKELFSRALSDIDEDEKEDAREIKQQFTDIYSIEDKFKKEKEQLEQLKTNMKSISELSKSIKDRLGQVEKQVDIIEDESKKSDKLSDKVWHIIDDLKARDLFYSLSGSYETVKNIQNFLKNDLSKDFSSTIKTTRDQIKKTLVAIEKLEDEGIIVRNRAARLEHENEKRLEELKERQTERKKIRRFKKKKVKKESLLTRIWNGFVTFLSWLYGVFN